MLGFRVFGFTFTTAFAIAAACMVVAAAFLRAMPRETVLGDKSRFVWRREYGLFYWLNVLFGTRKQIFLTFSPWVLVTVFKLSTQTVATLFFVGGLIGIGFNPLLGRAIDRLGERVVLMGEAAVLVFVCMGYGFSQRLFSGHIAVGVACACFVLDQMLMSVGMARATYLKKIAVRPGDVPQTLMMGVSIDHVFSILVASLGGIIMVRFGYEYVFLLGALIAVVNLFSAARVRVHAR
jgi:predicted MFS family arabinose efflux permease